MLPTILLTVTFFGIAFSAMALGVIFADRRLSGSCGGTGGSCACSTQTQESCAQADAAMDEGPREFVVDHGKRLGEKRLLRIE